MIALLLGIIFISAGLSLLSYVYCWQEVRAGHPHILALRQITAIMDRHQLNRLYGQHDAHYVYHLSPHIITALTRQHRGFFLRECAAEIVCMFGVWRYMTGHAHINYVGWFILLAMLCQGINVLYSMWLVKKWRTQLQEESEFDRDD